MSKYRPTSMDIKRTSETVSYKNVRCIVNGDVYPTYGRFEMAIRHKSLIERCPSFEGSQFVIQRVRYMFLSS